ncbi:MAG: PaaI family thioesterase [Planctomycetaceae bacterium]
MIKTLTPKSGNTCFGCGDDNPLGLKLSFEGDSEKKTAWTEFQPPPFLAGAIDMMHGGFISLLLDEVSSKVLSIVGKRGVTRTLEVSFDKPVPLDAPIRLEAELISEDRRKHIIHARIRNGHGDVLAHSEALFLVFTTPTN